MVTAAAVNHSPRSSPLHGQNHSLVQGSMASPPTLQGNPSLDEFCAPRRRGQFGSHISVQHQTSPVSGSTTGPTLVGIHRPNHTITSPPVTTNSQHHYHFGCLQHRLGSMLGDTTTGGTWSAQEMMHHIIYLELLAAFLAVQCFLKAESNMTIFLTLDNVTAVTFIMGGTHYKLLCKLALALWEWCIHRNLFLVAEHLPGQQNVLADGESRNLRDQCDWMINPQLFCRIQRPCQVNLFASHLTRQLPRFYNWRTDPEVEATDAFTQDWLHYRILPTPLGV